MCESDKKTKAILSRAQNRSYGTNKSLRDQTMPIPSPFSRFTRIHHCKGIEDSGAIEAFFLLPVVSLVT